MLSLFKVVACKSRQVAILDRADVHRTNLFIALLLSFYLTISSKLLLKKTFDYKCKDKFSEQIKLMISKAHFEAPLVIQTAR